MPGRQPIQPTVIDDRGVLRFQHNAIVDRLLQHALSTGLDLNKLVRENFDREDWVQFNQLTGYSVSGCPDMTDDERAAVERMVDHCETEMEARAKAAEQKIAALRDGLRETVAHLFDVHPDDLS